MGKSEKIFFEERKKTANGKNRKENKMYIVKKEIYENYWEK